MCPLVVRGAHIGLEAKLVFCTGLIDWEQRDVSGDGQQFGGSGCIPSLKVQYSPFFFWGRVSTPRGLGVLQVWRIYSTQEEMVISVRGQNIFDRSEFLDRSLRLIIEGG